jgi:hypothetical protein
VIPKPFSVKEKHSLASHLTFFTTNKTTSMTKETSLITDRIPCPAKELFSLTKEHSLMMEEPFSMTTKTPLMTKETSPLIDRVLPGPEIVQTMAKQCQPVQKRDKK